MITFQQSQALTSNFESFWSTVHSVEITEIYYHTYFFSILHGLGRLTGPPRFWIFFIGKAFLAIFCHFLPFLAIFDHFLAIFSPRHYLRDRQTCNTANTLHEAGHFRYRASTLRCDQNQILSVSSTF